MTCVVALVQDGIVYMGADSAVSIGYTTQTLASKKLLRQQHCLLGYSGDLRGMNLLAEAFVAPDRPQGMSIERYLVTLFVDALRTTLKDAGAAKKENEQERASGYFLIGYECRLFQVGCDYSVMELANDFDAIGSGSEVALGALHATRHLSLQPQMRLTVALEAAAKFCSGVGGPFVVESLEPEREKTRTVNCRASITTAQGKPLLGIQTATIDLKMEIDPAFYPAKLDPLAFAPIKKGGR